MTNVRDDDIGIGLYVDRLTYSPERTKQLFLALDEGFNRLGITPTRLAAPKTGAIGKSTYKTYRGLRPRLLKSDFHDVRHFVLECLRPDRPTDHKSWTAHADVARKRRIGLILQQDAIWRARWAPASDIHPQREDSQSRWRADWIVFPNDADLAEQTVLQELLRFGESAIDEYGYISWIRRGTHPQFFDMDLSFGSEDMFRTHDESWNRYSWVRFGTWTRRLLRDTYPINFLGRTYLDLPIEGTTLEKWILADSTRGTLEPFNSRVWVWRPVIEQIPYIREPLFRAGLLHWWRMFSVDDYCQLQVTEPFTPPAETPEMFRPEYYEGRNPKITN